MVRNLVVESQPAEPPIGQMSFDLLTIRANPIAVGNDEHVDQKLGVDRRASDVAVEPSHDNVGRSMTPDTCHLAPVAAGAFGDLGTLVPFIVAYLGVLK